MKPTRRLGQPLGIRISRQWYGDERVGRVYHTGRDFLMGHLENELTCRSYWFESYYEPHAMVCLKALDDYLDVFVDVGANVGVYPLYVGAGGKTKRIFAIDPHPGIYRILTDNIRLNGYQIAAEKIGLSDKVGKAEMHFPDSPTSGSLEEGFNSDVKHKETVEISTLDAFFLEEERLDPIPEPGRMMIKMDVLGHESSVLRGGRQLTEKVRPNFLLEAVKPFDEAELDFLTGLGYRFFLMLPGGLEEIEKPHHEVVDGFSYANFIATCNDEIIDFITGPESQIDFSGIDPSQTSLHGFMADRLEGGSAAKS